VNTAFNSQTYKEAATCAEHLETNTALQKLEDAPGLTATAEAAATAAASRLDSEDPTANHDIAASSTDRRQNGVEHQAVDGNVNHYWQGTQQAVAAVPGSSLAAVDTGGEAADRPRDMSQFVDGLRVRHILRAGLISRNTEKLPLIASHCAGCANV